MKSHSVLATFVANSFLALGMANASTTQQADPQAGGIGYRWTTSMSGNDSAVLVGHVGAWSWEDENVFGPGDPPVGWTHTSHWVALTLQENALLTLRLTNKDGVPNPISGNPGNIAGNNLFPGFSIYAGWDNDLAPQAFADANNGGNPTDDWHTYNNGGPVAWAEDIVYVGHAEHSGDHFVEQTFALPAGLYTIALGGNSASIVNEPRQGYEATITTVPEPGTAALALTGFLGLFAGRRKRLGHSQPRTFARDRRICI